MANGLNSYTSNLTGFSGVYIKLLYELPVADPGLRQGGKGAKFVVMTLCLVHIFIRKR